MTQLLAGLEWPFVGRASALTAAHCARRTGRHAGRLTGRHLCADRGRVLLPVAPAANGQRPVRLSSGTPRSRLTPTQLITLREHDWLASKVLLTAVRAHSIRSVTSRTGQKAVTVSVCAGQGRCGGRDRV